MQLSATTVGRMLKRKAPPVAPSEKTDDGLDTGKRATTSTAPDHEATPEKPPLIVKADYPHHVVWPFCHIVAIIVDH